MKDSFVKGNLNACASINPLRIFRNLKSFNKASSINDSGAELGLAMPYFSIGTVCSAIAGLNAKFALLRDLIAAFAIFLFQSLYISIFGASETAVAALVTLLAAFKRNAKARRGDLNF